MIAELRKLSLNNKQAFEFNHISKLRANSVHQGLYAI